jgi:uncharacterized membrane protein YccC
VIAGRHRKSNGSPPQPAALTVAVREAARFDRESVSVWAGLLAAIPVVAVLGGGIAAGEPVAAVTIGAGAMLVGTAWRTGGGRPPLALMATDAVLMATSTFVGCVTGSVFWLHLGVLCVWSLMAGLLVGVGNRGAVVGTQAIIAVVVFGRFSQPPLAALGLAGLILAGGGAQVLFLSIVRWPSPLRAQRAATASAYRVLSGLAAASAEVSTLPAATALDEAGATLASPTLFGDPALMTLRSLVNEGHRMRVQLSAIHALLRQQQDVTAHPSSPSGQAADRGQGADRVLELTATGLGLAAGAIEGDRSAAAALPPQVAELSSEVVALAPDSPTSGLEPATLAGPVALPMARRLSALAGQLRAVCALAPAAGEGGGLRTRRPQRRTNRPIERLRADLGQIRANASLDSPAGRHALRLAVVVPAAELISRQLPLQRGYWVVVAAATTLRPEFAATFTRGTERALGTCVGVALAGAIAVGLHPAGGLTVAIVGVLAWAGYATFPASFAVGFGFITALVVFLLNAISPDTLATASARLLDTLVGGSIGLLVYALWPTWSNASARQSLADVVDAQRDYVSGVLAALIDGRRAEEQQMRALARSARLARTNAEAAVARSLSEPATRRIDADQSQGTLGAMRRLIQAAHVLRLDAQEASDPGSLPTLAPLAADIDSFLKIVETTLKAGPDDRRRPPALADLRASYAAFERTCPRDRDGAALLAELDEIVDAANSLATLVGLDPVDADQQDEPQLGTG